MSGSEPFSDISARRIGSAGNLSPRYADWCEHAALAIQRRPDVYVKVVASLLPTHEEGVAELVERLGTRCHGTAAMSTRR